MNDRNVLTEQKLIEMAEAQLRWKFTKEGLTPKIIRVPDADPPGWKLIMEVKEEADDDM